MIGLVALADLHYRYAWDARPTDGIAERLGLVREDAIVQRFEPPAVVIAIATSWEQVEKSRGWLSRAPNVLLVYDGINGGEFPIDEVFETYVWRRNDELAGIVQRARELDGADPQEYPAPHVDHSLPSGQWIAHQLPEYQVAQQMDRVVEGEALLDAHQLHFVGTDPTSVVRWYGERMRIFWHHGADFMDAMFHDYPCGPAKKVHAGSNNLPRQICMSPTREAFVARFTHDVTFSTHVPVRWQRAGSLYVAAFAPDPHRAVFFEYIGYYGIDEEDARWKPPAMVLGPGCYAISLDKEVYKTTTIGTEHVGGPNDGFAVFDHSHTLLRRGEGKLLGGWYRHATIEHEAQWWREDLATGERTLLGRADYRRCVDTSVEAIAGDATLAGRLDEAARVRDGYETVVEEEEVTLAIPGTRNLLYVTDKHYRVI